MGEGRVHFADDPVTKLGGIVRAEQAGGEEGAAFLRRHCRRAPELGLAAFGGADPGVQDHKTAQEIGACDGQVQKRAAAEAMADSDRLFDAEFIAEPDQIIVDLVVGVARLRGVAGAVAAQVYVQHTVAAHEIAHLRQHVGVVAAHAVHEEQRRVARSRFAVGEPDAITGQMLHPNSRLNRSGRHGATPPSSPDRPLRSPRRSPARRSVDTSSCPAPR